MKIRLAATWLVLTFAATGIASPVMAGEIPEFVLTLKNHAYNPNTLKVPAGIKFRIRVTNADATAEEFESTDLNRETVVLPNRSVLVYVGPLQPGTYGFFGDFHRGTAQGRLIAE